MSRRLFDWDRTEISPLVWMGVGFGLGLGAARYLASPAGAELKAALRDPMRAAQVHVEKLRAAIATEPALDARPDRSRDAEDDPLTIEAAGYDGDDEDAVIETQGPTRLL